MAAPIPIGPTASFSNVPAGSIATSTFTMGDGTAVVTFQPVDVNNPGVVTLYDNSDNSAVLTLNSEGYEMAVVPPGGKTYYFKATLGAKILAMTLPTGS